MENSTLPFRKGMVSWEKAASVFAVIKKVRLNFRSIEEVEG